METRCIAVAKVLIIRNTPYVIFGTTLYLPGVFTHGCDSKERWQRRTVEGVVKIFPMRARKVPGMIPVVVLHNYGMLVGCEKAPIWHGVCTRIKRRSGQQKEEP